MSGIGHEHDNGIYNLCKKMSREKRIPFEVSVDPFYSENNLRALNESVTQLKEGNVVIKTIDELEEMANG